MDNKRSTLVKVLYRPPNGKIELLKTFLVKLLFSVQNANKNLHITGNFNLNLLDHESNKKVQDILNIFFNYRNGTIPTINKPTWVRRTTATTIDHILTNSFIDRNFKTTIFKSDVSDHFPICFIFCYLLPISVVWKQLCRKSRKIANQNYWAITSKTFPSSISHSESQESFSSLDGRCWIRPSSIWSILPSSCSTDDLLTSGSISANRSNGSKQVSPFFSAFVICPVV